MSEPLVLIPLVLVASLLSISVNWRIALGSLWAVHLLVSLWLSLVSTPEVALAKAITGTTVCALLWPSLRIQSAGGDDARRQARRALDVLGPRSTDEGFMLFGALIAAAAAIALSLAFPLVEGASNFAWYWLALLGLLLIVLSHDIVRVGLGLLLLVNAIDLVDTMVARNQGVFSIGARSVVAISLALALALTWSYLQARGSRYLGLDRDPAETPPPSPGPPAGRSDGTGLSGLASAAVPDLAAGDTSPLPGNA